MGKIKRLLLILMLLALASFAAFSDSLTLSTEINSVSYGVDDFGFGLFPIGTNFEYKKYFSVSDSLRNSALFDVEMQFDISSPWLSGYDYAAGKPWWSDGSTPNTIDRGYSRLSSYVQLYLQQGFGINPVDKSGALVDVRFTLFSRFFYNMERLALSNEGPGGSIFNKPPFTTEEHLPAYPWLEGDGQVWNNFLRFSTYWYLRQWRASDDIYDGAYLEVSFELGPSWLGNNILPETVTSSYSKAYFHFEQFLTIFQTKQDNGWNWFTLMLGHYDAVGYTWGDVIPENKIQTDRLRGYANDAVYLKLVGPQFMASDCYPVFQLSLYNNLSYGGVQNDISGQLSGIELRSSVNFQIRLKLFGFMNLRYECGYDFIRGFDTYSPGWWQNAEIAFYVSL